MQMGAQVRREFDKFLLCAAGLKSIEYKRRRRERGKEDNRIIFASIEKLNVGQVPLK